jgi:hypothetical protein
MNGFASRPWLIVPLCAAIHLTFAWGMIADPDAARITAMHFAHVLFGIALPGVLVLAAATALTPMVWKIMPPAAIHMCLWPQQFILFLMALSTISATFEGSYPDGTIRSAVFIYTDQCASVYLMISHLVAVIRNARMQ